MAEVVITAYSSIAAPCAPASPTWHQAHPQAFMHLLLHVRLAQVQSVLVGAFSMDSTTASKHIQKEILLQGHC